MDLPMVLTTATIFYFVTAITAYLNAEKIYNYGTTRNWIPDAGKGLFAQAIVSLFRIRNSKAVADSGDWAYCLSFNAVLSIIFGMAGIFILGILFAILSVVAFIIFLAMFFGD